MKHTHISKLKSTHERCVTKDRVDNDGQWSDVLSLLKTLGGKQVTFAIACYLQNKITTFTGRQDADLQLVHKTVNIINV